MWLVYLAILTGLVFLGLLALVIMAGIEVTVSYRD